jgi:hypothetical protein
MGCIFALKTEKNHRDFRGFPGGRSSIFGFFLKNRISTNFTLILRVHCCAERFYKTRNFRKVRRFKISEIRKKVFPIRNFPTFSKFPDFPEIRDSDFRDFPDFQNFR